MEHFRWSIAVLYDFTRVLYDTSVCHKVGCLEFSMAFDMRWLDYCLINYFSRPSADINGVMASST